MIILGPLILRESIAKAKLIGVLKLLDGGEQDDKLITVGIDSPLYKVDSLEELDEKLIFLVERSWEVLQQLMACFTLEVRQPIMMSGQKMEIKVGLLKNYSLILFALKTLKKLTKTH